MLLGDRTNPTPQSDIEGNSAMTRTSSNPPVVNRPDVEVVVVSRWTGAGPGRQRAVAEAILAEWEREPWPPALDSLNALLSTDGQTVLTYAQWTGDAARREFEPSAPPSLVPGIDDARAGLERSGPVSYRLYRSTVPDGSERRPGCIVIVDIEAEGPERARQWVDFMFDDVGVNARSHPGLISAHFHISTDGTWVLNYAEWTDEAAHQALIAADRPTEVMARIHEGVPGVRPVGFRRYVFHRSLLCPEPSNGA